jgi:hypothetical protein
MKMLQTGIVFIIALATFGGTNAYAISCPAPWVDPWVPNNAVAKAIYLAVGRAQHIPSFNRYPIVIVEDAGDHWNVWQESGKVPPTPKRGEVIVAGGGGQLSMEIDKCTGAISNAVLNR